MDAMYIALKQAVAGHSPTIVPPVSKPLVLAGPFGAACHKGELVQWLLQEYGSSIALPEMVTTKPREDGAVASSAFKVWSENLRRKGLGCYVQGCMLPPKVHEQTDAM